MRLEANYYDGLSAKPYTVWISAESGVLHLTFEEGRSETFEATQWQPGEPFNHAPRIIKLPQGHVELAESAELRHWLAAQGRGMSLVARAQWSWRKTLWAMALLAVTLAVLYAWGLPWAANAASHLAPRAYLHMLDKEALAQADELWVKPSTLDIETQDRIKEKFLQLQTNDSGQNDASQDLTLLFRSSRFGPNAFALPGGTIVLFDELVALAPSDEALLGVMAHEWAHVRKRHAVRGLIQNGTVGLWVAIYLGDASSMIATLGQALGFLHYSRQFETEADTFAIEVLRANRLSGGPTAELFERMTKINGAKNEVNIPEFLSSHPATAERVARFRALK